MTENLLDLIAYHEKWHSKVQKERKQYIYSPNEYLIEEIFNRINIKKGLFVEFGAWDGICLSNTRKLFKSGWEGILIESDKKRYEELKNNYKCSKNIITINQFLDTKDNLIDNIFFKYLNKNIDFCSIDIDGLDLDIFETFSINMPKVVCIEGGQILDPNHPRISSELSSHNIQQSLSTMNDVFESKGYKLLCSYQDAFFIQKKFFHLFNVDKNLLNNYIEGLIALPRIPYIKKILDNHNLNNQIIDQSVLGIPDNELYQISNNSDKNKKQEWINYRYSTIKKKP